MQKTNMQNDNKHIKKSEKEVKRYNYEYRDQDACDNQEVLTPATLVNLIYSYIDLTKINKVLDPCVGPGAMIEPFIDTDIDLTIIDIQEIHIG